jgi:hypothetical protein
MSETEFRRSRIAVSTQSRKVDVPMLNLKRIWVKAGVSFLSPATVIALILGIVSQGLFISTRTLECNFSVNGVIMRLAGGSCFLNRC